MKAHLLLGMSVGLVLLLLVMMSLHDWRFDDATDEQVIQASPIIVSYGVKSQIFDKQGKLDYTIDATEAREYDYKQLLELDAPHITVHRKEQWTLDAKQGSLLEADEERPREIIMTGEVEAHQRSASKLSLYSDELHYWPDREQVTSPGAVKILQQENTTRAGAMEADMKTGVITLKDGVESVYAAPAS